MIRILVLLLTFPIFAFALDYAEYPRFDSTQSYRRGDIVSYHNHLWVSKLPSVNHEPAKNSWKWGQVALTNIDEWRYGHLYFLGNAVSHQKKFYFVRKFGFAKPETNRGGYQWEAFSHPAIGYELPDIDYESANLAVDGVDSNFNGIRDDYEIFVVMEHTDPVLRHLGLQAAQLYRKLFAIARVDIDETSIQELALLTDQLVSLRVCNRQNIRTENGFNGYQHKYVNTPERFEEFLMAQKLLYEVLGDDYEPKVPSEPCKYITNIGGE
ncbi:hypothetical protein [Shewanella sp. GutDb-MelDb]|uniref:hypothetical protein n=1 Tax=Shewanella sp. GutDb-MelDb TaxID=2058316 RepID=UPI000C79B9A3|nr:hypothetical protein [Shewanella sp. GutDb-MelDb]PKG56136.1 hypothetical protein CXF82_16255 [Shewanella sp. GutDb-MelDb]